MTARKILSWLLLPLTMWYAVGVALRGLLFATGLLRQKAPHITTIGIGNLSCGGTGKTPHAEHLLRLLSAEYRVAYLSRGYRRESKGFVLCEGEPSPSLLGDEAAMVARKFPSVMVAVCERRVEGVRRLMALPTPPQVVVLDDVFQHRYIKPTCNILLTEFGRPYYADSILPFGNLREFRSGKDRASIVIVTKTPRDISPIARHNVVAALAAQPYQKVFFSSMRLGKPVGVTDGSVLEPNVVEHVMVVTGVAHPEPLVAHLAQYGQVTTRRFPDHHAFTPKELASLRAEFEAIEASRKVVVTTEKDAARLSAPSCQQALAGLPLYVVPMEVEMQGTPDFDFDTIIRSTVKENISFLSKLATSKLLQ